MNEPNTNKRNPDLNIFSQHNENKPYVKNPSFYPFSSPNPKDIFGMKKTSDRKETRGYPLHLIMDLMSFGGGGRGGGPPPPHCQKRKEGSQTTVSVEN
ncbi:hypothetical protein CDAR_544071 [Caerostris darwini]|uniref:Uncharacterized protein n=1 Tax=Caerostris darwini TaxID=1538125 RepID=A0AAV4TKN9_9ARAC|nr:hypothetical protein CDAR_544071 [Caerostris darwini]